MTADVPVEGTGITNAGARWWLATAAAIVLLAAGLTQLNPRWRWSYQSTPYPAAAVHARLTAALANTVDEAQVKLDALLGGRRLNAVYIPLADEPGVPNAARQQVVGQLMLNPPAKASGNRQYVLFVIDNRTNQPVPDLFGASRSGVSAASGWDGRYQRLAAKYPWLHDLAETHSDAGWSPPGMSISVPANTHGTITFDAVAPDDALPITDPARDLTFALVFVGSNVQPYWAQRLTPSA